jgi:hypothetical protein
MTWDVSVWKGGGESWGSVNACEQSCISTVDNRLYWRFSLSDTCHIHTRPQVRTHVPSLPIRAVPDGWYTCVAVTLLLRCKKQKAQHQILYSNGRDFFFPPSLPPPSPLPPPSHTHTFSLSLSPTKKRTVVANDRTRHSQTLSGVCIGSVCGHLLFVRAKHSVSRCVRVRVCVCERECVCLW